MGRGIPTGSSQACRFPTQVGMGRRWRRGRYESSCFPTQVGMGRAQQRHTDVRIPFPHVCGDGPAMADGNWSVKAFSPRLWGWAADSGAQQVRQRRFPTRVGMTRPCRSRPRSRYEFPHAGGDEPITAAEAPEHKRFSPQLWGWAGMGRKAQLLQDSFPTQVGMSRGSRPGNPLLRQFPHTSGDEPLTGSAPT
jgi:hypothetical protein